MWHPPKSKISIKVERLEDVPFGAYLTLEGSGDATNVMELSDALDPLFREGVNRLAFDLEKVKYFNDTFEGLVTKQAERLNGGEGILVLVRPHEKLAVILRLLGIEVYRFASSREDAIRQLKSLAGQKLTTQSGA